MAAYTSSKAKTFTLGTSVADSITLTGTGKFLRIAHNSTTAGVYVIAEPTGTTPATVTVLADNAIAVYGNQVATIGWPGTGANLSVITGGSAVTVNVMLHQ